MPSCSSVSVHDTSSFAFNILFHILILFSVLSAIYYLVISKVETDAFKKEIGGAVESNLLDALKENDKSGIVKQVLKTLPLDRLQTVYDKPTEATTVYNTWLYRTMILVIVSILATTLIAGLFLYYACGQCIPFWSILKENIITFLFVGAFEGIFFWYIARKFIPAPPSLMVDRVFSDLKKWN